MRWIPLEANPEMINQFFGKIGVQDCWKCVDVYSTDEELLNFVPKPVKALLLLYPLTDNVKNNPLGEIKTDTKLTFIKQTIGNACGTMGILHILCNNEDILKNDSYIKTFQKKICEMTPEERSKAVENDEFLSSVHEESALGGQTEAPDSSVNTELHFVAFVNYKNGIYELDGREAGPKYHGDCTDESFLNRTIDVLKKFMKRDPDQNRFNIIALAKTD